jgi:ABC-2 type transport system ATP-binding protein
LECAASRRFGFVARRKSGAVAPHSKSWQDQIFMSTTAIDIDNLRHRYGEREALAGISFRVERAEIFALLGPNGSGKTTLFKILSTLLRPLDGGVRIFGDDLRTDVAAIRRRLGVVFQRPSIDRKLTVRENLQHHGRLYGLGGARLRTRIDAMLERVGLSDRDKDIVETLSGGLQRRAELAKGLLHEPELLLLDEPSTGLDPGARREFMRYLQALREQDGVTVVLTTHHMEEAERCDRVGIMHAGRVVRVDTPDQLKAAVGGDVIVIHPHDAAALQAKIKTRFACEAISVDGTLRLERPRGHEFLRDLVEAFPEDVRSVSFGKPTLEDAFIHLTGDRFWDATMGASA